MKGYTGYLLDVNCRNEIKKQFEPKFTEFIGQHITTAYNVTADTEPEPIKTAFIIGYASDGDIEAFLVVINGKIKREDGKFFHLTWSLNPEKRSPKNANALFGIGKDIEAVEPIAIDLEPHWFPFKK